MGENSPGVAFMHMVGDEAVRLSGRLHRLIELQ